MTDCVEEQQTRHYGGRLRGFGPVRNDERVLFAVFMQTKRNGARLVGDSFDNKYLASSSQSLTRASYVTKLLFDREVVRHGESEKGPLVGVACADVADIRKLRADIQISHATIKKVRAICLLDRVDVGDLDGHATMGYAEAMEQGVSQKQLGKKRVAVRMDLANIFSDVANSETLVWPRHSWVLLCQIGSIIRGLCA